MSLSDLRRLGRVRRRRWLGRRILAEELGDALAHGLRVDVADDDEHGVRGLVVLAVEGDEVVAPYRTHVALPADRVIAVGMREQRGVDDGIVQDRRGIVLVAVQLREHGPALGLDLLLREEQAPQSVGFDAQREVELVLRQRLEVGRLVDPGVAVPLAADAGDAGRHLRGREVLRCAEGHVLEVMREARAPILLVTRARAIEHLNAHDGQAALLEHDQLEAVVQPGHRRLAEIQRRGGDAWQAREDDPRGKAQSSLHSIFSLFREAKIIG